MDKRVLCIWDVAGKPWVKIDLCPPTDDLEAMQDKGGLSLALHAKMYLPACCADRILFSVFEQVADFNIRHKDYTDLFFIEAVTAEETARKVARSFLGHYLEVLGREAQVARRERELAIIEGDSNKPRRATESIFVAFHGDSEYGMQAVGAYKDRKLAELECRMLALDCKYSYETIYQSEFSLHDVYGRDFFEKGGSGWNIFDKDGNIAHTFRVEELAVDRPIERKNYSWPEMLKFIQAEK